MSRKCSSESKCQIIEIGLKTEAQNQTVRDDIYNVQNRLENVTRRIAHSGEISQRNRDLIWKFCESCQLQGLSSPRILLYLNRFWNISRLATKNFDQMTKKNLQRLVTRIREIRKRTGERLSERTDGPRSLDCCQDLLEMTQEH